MFFGDEQEWSIGYNVPVGGAKIDSKSGVREISTLELYEYSPVLFGAMPLARTTSVKDAQLAMKQLRGSAASWLASQTSAIEEVEIPEAEEGKGMDMDMESEEDEMIVEDKERMLSSEQMDLVKQAIEVLRDILDASQDDETEEKGMGMYDKEEMPTEDDEEKKEIIGFDTLTEAITTMITDAKLPQKVLEGMSTAAGAFDEAMKTKNMDALDIAGNQLLDMIEMSMESADENTQKILRGIAVTLAEFITKVTGEEDGENKPMEDEPATEESVEKKVTLSLEELNDFVKYMKGE